MRGKLEQVYHEKYLSCLYLARIRLGPENEAAFGNVINESKQSICSFFSAKLQN